MKSFHIFGFFALISSCLDDPPYEDYPPLPEVRNQDHVHVIAMLYQSPLPGEARPVRKAGCVDFADVDCSTATYLVYRNCGETDRWQDIQADDIRIPLPQGEGSELKIYDVAPCSIAKDGLPGAAGMRGQEIPAICTSMRCELESCPEESCPAICPDQELRRTDCEVYEARAIDLPEWRFE